MVAGQKVALGRIHARRIVTVHVSDATLAIELPDNTSIIRRTTTQPIAAAFDVECGRALVYGCV